MEQWVLPILQFANQIPGVSIVVRPILSRLISSAIGRHAQDIVGDDVPQPRVLNEQRIRRRRQRQKQLLKAGIRPLNSQAALVQQVQEQELPAPAHNHTQASSTSVASSTVSALPWYIRWFCSPAPHPTSTQLDPRPIERRFDESLILMTQSPVAKLTESNWKTLLAICDAIIPPVDKAVLEPHVTQGFDKLDELAGLTPSTLPGFKESLELALSRAANGNVSQLVKTVKILGIRPLAVILTGSRKLLTEMTQNEKEAVLLSWRESKLSALLKLYKVFTNLTLATYVRLNKLGYAAVGHPEFDERFETIDFDQFFKYQILNLGEFATSAEIETDVVIVGSGSGAGVVASQLAKAGHSVLVLEKGKYFHQSELKFNEDMGFEKLYDNGGIIAVEDASMNILAGSTLGGGTTVNWSASLRTPDDVRKQWAAHVPWYDTKQYDEAMDFVLNQMGCSTDHITHNLGNKIILEGSKKLGWPAKEVPQNTGNQAHECGQCGSGCFCGIKQGGVVNWLKEAVEHGAQILDETLVTKIDHSHGHATGVEALVKNKTRLIVRAKRVVVSAGSLQTPLVLQRSNFKNKKIGHGLKLHPVTCVSADFPQDLHSYKDPILTAVGTKFVDLDGRHHGPRLETVIQQPMIEMTFVPWQNGEDCRRELVKYNKRVSILVITRDRSYGRVFFDKSQPLLPRIDYSINQFDRDALRTGCVGAAKLLYIEGALRIIQPHPHVPVFESSKPVQARSVDDPDFQKWLKIVEKHELRACHTPFGCAHQMASCRMSKQGRKQAPLDDHGRLWECPNVYVADASTLPSASGVNPMVSTMATAYVLSQFIKEDLKKDKNESLRATPRL